MHGDRSSRDLLGTLDFCRGVAILMVVGYHCLQAWYGNFGWQGVHVFVVMSGFVLTFSAARKGDASNWKLWFRRRMRRILPAYWMTAIAGFVVVLLFALAGLNDPAVTLGGATRDLVLDLLLLRNFSYVSMLAYPNAALWFVPFIAGFYLVFPFLFGPMTRARGTLALVGLVAAMFAVEAIVRGLAIAFLDGAPVGYGQGFLASLGRTPQPLDRIPNDSTVFQLWAPFGLFPTRIGEFALGMAVGAVYVRDPQGVSRKLTGLGAALAGTSLWAAGNWLVYAGRGGWPAADFVIAAGLSLLLPPLALQACALVPRFSGWISAVGRSSYHLFLVHLLVMYVYVRFLPFWISSIAIAALMLPVVVAAIVAATWLLRRFDESPIADLLMPLPRASRTSAQ